MAAATLVARFPAYQSGGGIRAASFGRGAKLRPQDTKAPRKLCVLVNWRLFSAHGFGDELEFNSAANRGGLRTGEPRRVVSYFAGGRERPAAGSRNRSGQTGFDVLRRKQVAGGEGKDSVVPRQIALALHRPSAIQQMPRRRGAVRDDPKRGQPCARAGNRQARRGRRQDDARVAGSECRGRGEQIWLPAETVAGGTQRTQCAATD